MVERKKLYLYDVNILSEEVYCGMSTAIISEVKLPRKTTRSKLANVCAQSFTDAHKKMKVGETADILVGDPVILRKATRLDLRKNPVPHIDSHDFEVERDEYKHNKYYAEFFNQVFEWNGGRVWIWEANSCLLSDALK